MANHFGDSAGPVAGSLRLNRSVPPRLCGWLLLGLLSLAWFPPWSRAQLVLDGTTNVFNNVDTNLTGSVVVGTNSPFTVLILTNSATLTNGGNATIGYNSASDSNRVHLTGSTTRWVVGSNLTVGRSGSGNLLVVSNDAFLSTGSATIGATSGASNTAIVTGNGVAGLDGLWTNAGLMTIGLVTDGNRLIVSNTADVFTGDLTLGSASTSANNEVIVTGGLADLEVADQFLVGGDGSNNRLWITNSGEVRVRGSLIVGATTNSSGNRVTIGGGILRVTNATGTAIYDLRRGTNQFLSGTMDIDQLVLTNSAGEFDFEGGSLTVRGGLIGLGGLVVGQSLSVPATLDVRAGASNFTVTGPLQVSAANSLLLVTNGQRLLVTGTNLYPGNLSLLGGGVTGTNARAIIAGSGSVWSNEFSLAVGSFGASARLVVSNGGVVISGDGIVGLNSISSNNLAVVTGTGSLWSNRGDLLIGSNSAFNTLLITNGGRVASTIGYAGKTSTASNNVALVTGTGSQWNNSSNLYVGLSGSGNQLVVSNGGRVVNGFGFLGDFSDNNVAVVTGAGSLWTNSRILYVGFYGSGNQLVVSNGGTVVNTSGSIGDQFSASNNTALVTGTGSQWNNSSNFYIGFSSSGNQLVVSNGGRVVNSIGIIGDSSNANNNVALVTGAGSLWNNSSDFYVGASGSGNQLAVSNGGTVANGSGFIGDNTGASNNVAVVVGAGSLWTNSSFLYVGFDGSRNQLTVSNGGRVANNIGSIGFNPTADNNVALVTGAGSVWSNNFSLHVGFSGSGSQLLLSNGGLATATNVTIGLTTNSSNNLLRLDNGLLTVTNAAGTGTLDVRRGSLVFNGGTITADRLLMANGPAGLFLFNDGVLNARSAAISNGSVFTVGNGTAAATYRMSGLPAGVHNFASGLVIASNAALTGNGTIVGSVTNFGTIAPGSSPGALTLNSDLSLMSSASLSFELGGLIATNQYDVLNVVSFVELAGTLSLSLINNFFPGAGDTFTLLKFGSSSGAFANLSGGRVSLTNNFASFAVTQTATNLIVGDVRYTDSDGDGQGDLQELAAETDMNNPGSYLHITSITRNPSGHLTLQWQVAEAKFYRVLFSDDLVTWNVVTGASFTQPSVLVLQFVDDGTLTGGLPATQRFYRVGLQ